MIVYRVAQGKGWTKDTYAQVSTFTAGTSRNGVQLKELSTLRVAQSDTIFTHDEAVKSVGTGSQITQDIYMVKQEDSYSAAERV